MYSSTNLDAFLDMLKLHQYPSSVLHMTVELTVRNNISKSSLVNMQRGANVANVLTSLRPTCCPAIPKHKRLHGRARIALPFILLDSRREIQLPPCGRPVRDEIRLFKWADDMGPLPAAYHFLHDGDADTDVSWIGRLNDGFAGMVCNLTKRCRFAHGEAGSAVC
jgi:hypothetical protein